jgi:selenocysteine lyase/cysteine desulfurase
MDRRLDERAVHMDIKVRIGQAAFTFRGALESHFQRFREQTIGIHHHFDSPFGKQRMIYADWTASGRLYAPIEKKLSEEIGPFVANTHTESNITGTKMTLAYKKAKEMIKHHVNANTDDVIIMTDSGTTGAINKLQRILGIRIAEQLKNRLSFSHEERPIIFVTHMEHHSNILSWMETIGDVVTIRPTNNGDVDMGHLKQLLNQYRHRKVKIGAFTACSNVTGIQTPYHQLAKIMHEHGGVCFVDFAASAPYTAINMHPDDPLEKLDGIFFSPHKFLGGPGSAGVLIFDSRLYQNNIPDHPGGGTVLWTNPWGEYQYISDIEAREDGGTPPFLQTIKAALAIKLKEQMGVENIIEREKEMVSILLSNLKTIPHVHILEGHREDRLGIVSFTIEGIHYNLAVKLLNDRFGIQVRGGCSCAGPYGHYLLKIDKQKSKQITQQIQQGNFLHKPGWIRVSLHPIMTNEEIYEIVRAIRYITLYKDKWKKDYIYSKEKNEFYHLKDNKDIRQLFEI